MLKIYNSQTRNKALFEPLEAGKVKLYVCGMTVYDLCHIGHARVLVVFDMVVRYLRHLGFDVTYIRNVTDIDDKIIKRATENGETISELTTRFIAEMHHDAALLGVEVPDQEPLATGHMPEIVSMIQSLLDKGYAYQAKNSDIYYSVNKFENYGQLSGKKLEDLRAGERVAVDDAKQDPLDFVLWKASKPNEPEDAKWDAPWGQGRPGWHIECSAMATHCLGDSFDIHGGGMDLMFPHHENEIAQSEAATGHKFVATWMHNGFVNIDNEKMSKSLGNFFTVREVLKQYHPEVIRYFILTSHYRSPLNYSDKNLDNAKSVLDGFYAALNGINVTDDVDVGDYGQRFNAAMNDDFNTPEALAILSELRRELNAATETQQIEFFASVLKKLGEILGLLQADPGNYRKGLRPAVVDTKLVWNVQNDEVDGLSEDDITALIKQRLAARGNKDWAESDRIRDELKAQGIVLEDGADGTTWRRE